MQLCEFLQEHGIGGVYSLLQLECRLAAGLGNYRSPNRMDSATFDVASWCTVSHLGVPAPISGLDCDGLVEVPIAILCGASSDCTAQNVSISSLSSIFKYENANETDCCHECLLEIKRGSAPTAPIVFWLLLSPALPIVHLRGSNFNYIFMINVKTLGAVGNRKRMLV